MRIPPLLPLLAAALLSSCAANFGSHLDAMKSEASLSASGKAPSFVVDESRSGTRKIEYAYSKMLADYPEYAKQQPPRSDSTTRRLISQRLIEFGMTRRTDQSELASAVITYRQILGWDMGEIVKSMTICAETKSETKALMDCAKFSEMKMANSHPTRKLVVDNLLAILLTTQWPSKADTSKYSRTSMEPNVVVDPD